MRPEVKDGRAPIRQHGVRASAPAKCEVVGTPVLSGVHAIPSLSQIMGLGQDELAAPVKSEVGTRIRYMGNKKALASSVADLCGALPAKEPLIDLFGGMCNVAGALAPSHRPVEVNDIQCYAELAARCLIASRSGPPTTDAATTSLAGHFEENRAELRKRFSEELAEEELSLDAGVGAALRRQAEAWPHPGEDEACVAELASLRVRPQLPYRLCTLTFAHGYFGLAQSVDLDSIRFAIDAAPQFDANKRRWLRLALLQTASRVASAPGHFAQFLQPNSAAAISRICAYRRRPVWEYFLEDVGRLRPYGTVGWRRTNRVHRGEAEEIVKARDSRAIYYADPPYSKEQYSRFYHVLETLELYDYPEAVGAGRYRPDRFYSPFARASTVVAACESLFDAVAQHGGVLLFSYPSSGLLGDRCGVKVGEVLASRFGDVRLAIDRLARHSTLGARHGISELDVREQVWVAQ
jgi:adenine-specific DNA-methyltransferase